MVHISAQVLPGAPHDALVERARNAAGRKIFRLLESMSIPPFAVAHQIFANVPRQVLPDCGLIVVSGWEPDVPPEVDPAPDAASLISMLQEAIPPTRWLTGLPNNTLCQIAISLGIQGPNMHLVGGGDALLGALELAEDTLVRHGLPHVGVIAFDPIGAQVVAPDITRSVASGILVSDPDTPGAQRVDPAAEATADTAVEQLAAICMACTAARPHEP